MPSKLLCLVGLVTADWCEGAQREYDACGTDACADPHADDYVDAKWGVWNEWGECDCRFIRERSRAVVQQHKYSGMPISGASIEAEACTPDAVTCKYTEPVDCQLEDWTSWDECTCSKSQVYRFRKIKTHVEHCGNSCKGAALNETRACNMECTEPVDCGLSKWSHWDSCTASCGGGQQKRTRVVETYPKLGGAECNVALIETQGCNEDCCPGEEPQDCEWGDWNAWSACSAECDGGERARQRVLAKPPAFGGEWCTTTPIRVVEGCNTNPCDVKSPVNGKWAEWSGWGDCSAECGGGYQHRHRSVEVEPANGGNPPAGDFEEYKKCNEEICKKDKEAQVDCQFTAWSKFGGCSRECNGYQAKNREVQVHAKNGGKICDGELRYIQACNVDSDVCKAKLPKRCEFEEWSEWGLCSEQCGGGTKEETRGIKRDAAFSGEGCTGNMKNVKSCNVESCHPEFEIDQDCLWSLWTEWGACSRTCEGGSSTRWRAITQAAKNDGKACHEQESLQIKACHPEPCATEKFCIWAAWGSYSDCSATCDGGERYRERKITITVTPPEEDALASSYSLELAMLHLQQQSTAAAGAQAVCALMGGLLVGFAGLSVYRKLRPASPEFVRIDMTNLVE